MTLLDINRMLKWVMVAVIAALISWFAFRGYLSPEFLVGFSLSC